MTTTALRTDTDLLTTQEVAHRLRVDTKTLANWRYLGRGPDYVKDGRVVRYRRVSVDAWIAEHEVAHV